MADSLPATPTDGDAYVRGVEDYRKEQGERRDLNNRGSSPRRSAMRRSSSRSPRRRSRSPIRRRSRSPRRDDRYRENKGRGSRTIRDKECRVYVSNLNYDTKWMELKDVMKKIGQVEHVEVLTDGSGRSKGCAVVEYANRGDAVQAIKELDGYELLGRKLRMREDNMDDATYKEQLKTQKDKTKMLKDHHSQMSDHSQLSGGLGGLGAFGGLNAAGGGLGGLSALLGAQTAQIQLLTMLNSKGGEPINSSVFVSNLDYEISWQKLKDMFRRAGNCIRCDIAEDDNRRSKGFGSVQFETPMEALTAVAVFNGMEMGNARRVMIVRLDRNASLHQALTQLGVNSKDINQQTIIQIQSLATICALGGGLGGGLGGALGGALGGGLGGLGNLAGLGVGGLNALGGFGALNQTNALTGLQSNQSTSTSSGLNLSNLAGLGTLSGLGSLLGSSGLTGNALQGVSSAATSGSVGGGYGLSSSATGYSSQSSSFYGGSSQGDRRVSESLSRGFSSSNTTVPRVFVRNLPFSITWQDLKDKFRDAGSVVRADVKTGDDGRSKGYAVVTFDSPVDANKAVALFNGCRMQGREIEVRIDRS